MARQRYKKDLRDRLELFRRAYSNPDGSINMEKLARGTERMNAGQLKLANRDRRVEQDKDMLKKLRKSVKDPYDDNKFNVDDYTTATFKSDPLTRIRESLPKKDDRGVFDGLGNDFLTPLKHVGQALNPFDDVSFTEAFKQNVEDAMSTDRSKVNQEVSRALTRADNTATLGLLNNLDKKQDIQHSAFQNRDGAGKYADFAYDLAGYGISGAGAAKILRGLGLGAKGNSIGQLAKEGALTGAGIAGTEVGISELMNPDDQNWKQNLTKVGLESLGGGILDPALVKGGGKVFELLKRFKPDTPMPTMPKQRFGDIQNTQVPYNVLANPVKMETGGNTFSSVRPSQFDLKANVSRNDALAEEYQKALSDQVDLLKSQMGQGVESGGLIRDQLGDVVDRYGRISNNPQWYQEFYAREGRAPTQRELQEIAATQLREGYSDDIAGQIPAWSPEQVQQIDEELQAIRDLYEQTGDESLLPTIDSLEQGRAEVMDSINPSINVTSQPKQDPLAKLTKGIRKEFEAITPMKDPGLKRSKVADIDQTVGDSSSFNAKVDRTPKKENKLMDTLKSLRTQFVDDLAPLERLEKSVTGKVSSAEDSLYKTARLLKGSPERANEIVRQKFSPVLNEVEKLGYTADDLGDYALAVHARDVNAKGLNSGFTDAEIQATIEKFKPLEKAREELIKVSDDILKTELLDSEVISNESYNAMREKWPNYMPLLRSFDDDKIEFGAGLGKSLANASSPIKKLEGSSRNVIDPLESMVKNVFKSTNAADRNRVGKQLAKLSEKDTQGLITKLEPNEKVDRKNVVSVMENGKKVKYEVPPEIYETIQQLDKDSSNILVDILQKPAATLRAGATLTPEFSLRNWMRDVPMAAVVSDSGFNPLIDFPVGLFHAIFKGRNVKVGGKEFKAPGKLYQQFIEDNGGYGNIVSMDRNVHRKAIQNVMKEGNTKKYVNVVNPKQWLELLRAVADVSETATKLGEYRAALRSGTSRQEAAYRARDIMDFARAGSGVRQLNKVVAFLNANIQGKSKLWRALKENPKRTTARTIGMIAIPSFGISLMQRYMSNEEQQTTINDAPSWLKNTFWLVPIPGTDQVARIPKPFDLAPVANLVERSFDYIAENDPDAMDGYLKETMSTAAVPAMVTGILPLIEGMANYSFFRQGPIIPMREQDQKFPDQYDINTSETAKLIGKGVNKVTGGQGPLQNFGSPRIIDNTIQGLTGGLGKYATDAIDLIVEGSGLVDDPEKPDKQVNQMPLLRSFLVNQTSTGESVGKLYDTLDKLRKERGSARKNGREYKKEAKYDQVSDITRTISDITKDMRAIENDPKLSGAEKRKKLDKLNEERNQFARESLRRLQGR